MDQINQFMDEESKKDSLQEMMSLEEYEELVTRLKLELLEEVKNSVEKETNESASDAGEPAGE